jgi:TPR repeat protein
MYERGEGVLPNNIKAQEHLTLAVELGDDRAKNKTVLANAKEVLKHGDREKAKSLFAAISASSKEAEMGVIACNAVFKSNYDTRIVYSYHSSGKGTSKKFWKWGDAVKTELDLTMSNNSTHSWPGMVKALIRAGDGFVNISTIGGVLKAGEIQSNIINPKDYGASTICGVAVYSDREGSVDKPVYSFHFPDVSIKPDEEETKILPNRILIAQDEMNRHNKTAKPGACFVLTVCYGSYDAPTVLAFRQFRDNHLSQYKLGRRFISWYYTHGPIWADAIDDKPRVKAIFRSVFNHLAKVLPR